MFILGDIFFKVELPFKAASFLLLLLGVVIDNMRLTYCTVLCMASVDDVQQFSQCAAEFSSQQGHARQRAQMQELPVNSTQAGIQPTCNNSTER